MDKVNGYERLAGAHVVVVDDNRDARSILETLLRYCGALVTTVSSAPAALRLLRHVRPHVFVIDLAMPTRDGRWLIKNIRGLKPHKGGNVPALAISAYDEEFPRSTVLSLGFQDYLVKPIDLQELAQSIERLSRQPAR